MRGEVRGGKSLRIASLNGHNAVVPVLLDNGADPNTRNELRTALGLAQLMTNSPSACWPR